MRKSSVRDFLGTQGFKDVKILKKLEGEHNHNYVFRSGDERFVLRKSKEHLDEENRLRSERNVLEFLNHKGIEFTPKSISYNGEQDIHITTYVGSEDISLGKLNQKDLEKWISNLAEVHSLNYGEFKEFCNDRNYQYNRPETVSRKVEEIREKLDDAGSTEKELVDWTEKELENLDYSSELDTPRLTHHDIHNSTRKSPNHLFIIDWEFAGFSYNPMEDIADVLINENLNEEQSEVLISHYKNLTEIELNGSVLKESKKLKLLYQLSWSLVEISKLRKNQKSAEKYLRYARERKEKFSSIEK